MFEQIATWIVPKRTIAAELARFYQHRLELLNRTVYVMAVVAVTPGAPEATAFPYKNGVAAARGILKLPFCSYCWSCKCQG